MDDSLKDSVGVINRKGIMLIADGLGDRPIKLLNDQTPSEYAATPTLDLLCSKGIAGLVHPYQAGCTCGTDWGHLCLFGYNPEKFYSGRGSLEAISANIDLQQGDIAFRGNLATVDDELTVIDRRAGRIKEKEDIAELLSAIEGINIDGCLFIVKPLTEHRVAVVMRGEGLSDGIVSTDPGTGKEGYQVVDPTLNLEYPKLRTAELLKKFLVKIKEIFETHSVNAKRKSKGMLPVNMILTRGCGVAMIVPSFQTYFPKVKVACIAGDETIIGIAKMCNFDGYAKPEFTGGFETDLRGKAELALSLLEKYDLVIVHVKGTDLCGHDNLPLKKVEILQKIDGMFAYWLENIDQDKTYLSMISDHSTPCHHKEHSADPVPSFICGPNLRVDSVCRFGERYMSQGLLNNYRGNEFMKTLMDYMSFSKKYGD